jgi:hypothetical protein
MTTEQSDFPAMQVSRQDLVAAEPPVLVALSKWRETHIPTWGALCEASLSNAMVVPSQTNCN